MSSIASPSHDISSSFTFLEETTGLQYYSHTRLSGKVAVMDRDFVLIIECDDPLKATVVYGEYYNSGCCVMVSMAPCFTTDEERCEMVFLVDCSGSMGGK